MLFNLIINLQKRIDELEARLDDAPAAPAASPLRHRVDPDADGPGTAVATYVDFSKTAPTADYVTYTDTADIAPAEPAPAEPASLQEQERAAIVAALDRNGGQRKSAAAELGISPRTLYRKIKDYGLE